MLIDALTSVSRSGTRAGANGAPRREILAGVHGIILAGVHAWGADVLEHLIARPLLPVADRPLIAHILTWLAEAGVRHTSVCANSDTSLLRKCLGDGSRWDVCLEYYEDVMPRGPAGCVRDAVVGTGAAASVVVDGTIVPEVDLADVLARHRQSQAAMTVVAAEAGPDQARGDSALRPLGIYVFSRSAWEQVPEGGYQDIKEKLIPRLCEAGQTVALHAVSAHAAPRVSGVASYLAVSRWAVRRLVSRSPLPAGYAAVGESVIHETADVHAGTRLAGPVLVGPHCRVQRGAIISGPTALGPGARIGASAIVSRSVLWSDCRVGEGALVDQSILCDQARIGAGARIRNTIHIEARAGRRQL
ncbi:MAG TPA: NDP-sugar synthase [Phycisphaerae bacterium]|jgi:NDP-sugar pyrophosphorylase family protein